MTRENDNDLGIHMKYIAERFDRLEARIEGLRVDVGQLKSDGCAQGKIHTRDIEELKAASGGKAGALAGGSIAAMILGVIEVVRYFVQGKP